MKYSAVGLLAAFALTGGVMAQQKQVEGQSQKKMIQAQAGQKMIRGSAASSNGVAGDLRVRSPERINDVTR